MTRTDILQFLTLILKEKCQLSINDLTEDIHLSDDLQLDSVNLLTLSVEIENQLKIILLDDPESPPMTVRQIIDLIVEGIEQRDQS